MTWARAVLVLRHLRLADRLKSSDRDEAQRAAMDAERAALAEDVE